jgi:hypothetical protein
MNQNQPTAPACPCLVAEQPEPKRRRSPVRGRGEDDGDRRWREPRAPSACGPFGGGIKKIGRFL